MTPGPDSSTASTTRAMVAGVVGMLVVVGIAGALGKPAGDTVELIMIAGGAALVTGGLGAVALHLLRGRSFSAQVVVVALTSTAAVTAGSLAAGNAMFLEARDLQTLAVVVSVGAVVAIVAALLLGERVGAASRSLGEVARRLGELGEQGVLGDAGEGMADLRRLEGDPAMPETMIREFARLAEQLHHTRVELEESRARERATDRARRELVSWVSHDLRTPLAGIRAITELLEDDLVTDPEEVQGYYATLRREADKLAALVGDLFEVSKIEAGALHLEYGEVNLGDLVSDTLAAAIPVAEQRGITVHGRADPVATIEGSLPELSRVLRNLVSNAIRESVDGGTVLVEAGLVDGGPQGTPLATRPHGRLAVTDTCGGIPPDVLERMFEASYRGEHARTPRSDGGAGLGLAIARGFVEAHGGRIIVDNVPGGCRFTVLVPVARPEPPTEPSPDRTPARDGQHAPPWDQSLPPVPLGEPIRVEGQPPG